MLRHDQARAGHEPFRVDPRSPDFVAPAGGPGVEASGVDGFGAPLRERPDECAARSGPNVLVVRGGVAATGRHVITLVPQELGCRT